MLHRSRVDIEKHDFCSSYRGWVSRRMRYLILLMCLVGLCLWPTTLSLKICAFNVQSFGEAKANNKKVMAILTKVWDSETHTWYSSGTSNRVLQCSTLFVFTLRVLTFTFRMTWLTETVSFDPVDGVLPHQIIARCDLCLIQEVRDSKGEAIPKLVKNLNK